MYVPLWTYFKTTWIYYLPASVVKMIVHKSPLGYQSFTTKHFRSNLKENTIWIYDHISVIYLWPSVSVLFRKIPNSLSNGFKVCSFAVTSQADNDCRLRSRCIHWRIILTEIRHSHRLGKFIHRTHYSYTMFWWLPVSNMVVVDSTYRVRGDVSSLAIWKIMTQCQC